MTLHPKTQQRCNLLGRGLLNTYTVPDLLHRSSRENRSRISNAENVTLKPD
jgi:hypothetical protein